MKELRELESPNQNSQPNIKSECIDEDVIESSMESTSHASFRHHEEQQSQGVTNEIEINDMIVKEEPKIIDYVIEYDKMQDTPCYSTESNKEQDSQHSSSRSGCRRQGNYKNSEYSHLYKKIGSNFICTLCPQQSAKKYTTSSSVYGHIKHIHFEFRFICTECGKKFHGRRELDIHYKKIHKMNAPASYETTSTDKPSVYESVFQRPNTEAADRSNYAKYYKKLKNLFHCNICSITFDSRTKVYYHIKINHFGVRFTCELCAQKFRSLSSLQKHKINLHSSNKADKNRKIVRKVFDFKNTFQTVDNCFICLLCPKNNSQKYECLNSLRSHVRRSHFQHRYRCADCRLKFFSRKLLVNHQKKEHNTLRPSKYQTTLLIDSKVNDVEQFKSISKLNARNTRQQSQRDEHLQLTVRAEQLQANQEHTKNASDLDTIACQQLRRTKENLETTNNSNLDDCIQVKNIENPCSNVKHKNYQNNDTESLNSNTNSSDVLEDLSKQFFIISEIATADAAYKQVIDNNEPKTEPQKIQFNYKHFYKRMANIFQCTICLKKLKSRETMRYHLKTLHFDTTYTCTECSKTFKVLEHLQKHRQRIHKKSSNKTDQLEHGTNDDAGYIVNEIPEIPFKYIQKKFNFRNTFKKLNNHYVCLLCPKDDIRKYEREGSMRNHVRRRHFQCRFPCTLCGAKLLSNKALEVHCEKQHKKLPILRIEINSHTKSNITVENEKADDVLLNSTVYPAQIACAFEENIPPEETTISTAALIKTENSTECCFQTSDDAILPCDLPQFMESVSTSLNAQGIKTENLSLEFNTESIQAAELQMTASTSNVHHIESNNSNEFLEISNKTAICSEKPASNDHLSQLIENISQQTFSIASHINTENFSNEPISSQLRKNEAKFANTNDNALELHSLDNQYHNKHKQSNHLHLKKLYKKIGNFYICTICSNKFRSTGGVKHHIRSIHLGIAYSCNECGEKLKAMSSLKEHKFRLHGSYNTKLSLYKYKSKRKQMQFRFKNTFRQIDNYYICLLCPSEKPMKYESCSSIRTHVRRRHYQQLLEGHCLKPLISLPEPSSMQLHDASGIIDENVCSKKTLNRVTTEQSEAVSVKEFPCSISSEENQAENSQESISKSNDLGIKMEILNETNINSKNTNDCCSLERNCQHLHSTDSAQFIENLPEGPTTSSYGLHAENENSNDSTLQISNEDIPTLQTNYSYQNQYHKEHKNNRLNYRNLYKIVGKLYMCTICSHKFHTLGGVAYHIKSSHLGIAFTCNECGEKLKSMASLRIHKLSLHSLPSDSEVTYSGKKRLPSYSKRKRKQRQFRFKDTFKKIDNYYICLFCASDDPKKYDNSSSLQSHVRRQHYQQLLEGHCRKLGTGLDDTANDKKCFQKLPVNENEALVENPTGNGDESSAEMNDKSIAQNESFQVKETPASLNAQHIKTENFNESSMEITDETFQPNSSNAPHITTFTKDALPHFSSSEKQQYNESNTPPNNSVNYKDLYRKIGKFYACNICSKKFNTIGGATYHVKSLHLGIAYTCNKCGEKLKSASSLRVHIESRHRLPSDAESNWSSSQEQQKLSSTVKSKRKRKQRQFCFKDTFKKIDNYYICLFCASHDPKKYENSSSLQSHVRRQHYQQLLEGRCRKLATGFDDTANNKKCSEKLPVHKNEALIENPTVNSDESIAQNESFQVKETPASLNAQHIKTENFNESSMEITDETFQPNSSNAPHIKTLSKDAFPHLSSSEKQQYNESNTPPNNSVNYKDLYRKIGKFYACNICSKKFNTIGGATYHVKSLHLGIAYTCNKCGEKLKSASSLRVHIESLHRLPSDAESNWSSSQEQQKLSSTVKSKRKRKQRQFRFKDTFKKIDNYYICLFCASDDPMKYESCSSIRTHVRRKHYQQLLDGRCRKLGTSLDDTVSLDLDNSSQPNNNLNYKDLYKKSGNRYMCNICSKKFDTDSGATYHVKTIHLGVAYTCNICGEKLKSPSTLRAHIARLHSLPSDAESNRSSSQEQQTQSSTIKSKRKRKRRQFRFKSTFQQIDNSFICLLCPSDDPMKYESCSSIRTHVRRRHYQELLEGYCRKL